MLTVCIQAGGASSRMGEDKALKPFLGRPLIQRVIDRLSPIADELIVTTNRPEDYHFLGLRLIPDLKPGRGALGGLYTAVASATHPLVAVAACDMPFASPTLLEAAGRLMVQEEADVVIAKTEEGYEPIAPAASPACQCQRGGCPSEAMRPPSAGGRDHCAARSMGVAKRAAATAAKGTTSATTTKEAIESGAFWFYHKLGFRPVKPRIRALADAESKKIATRKGYRSPESVLKRLAKSDKSQDSSDLQSVLNQALSGENRPSDLLELADLFNDISALGEAERKVCIQVLNTFAEYRRSTSAPRRFSK